MDKMNKHPSIVTLAAASVLAVFLFGCQTPPDQGFSDGGEEVDAAKPVVSAKSKRGAPEWVANQGASRSYPKSRYLSGYGTCSVTKEISKDEAVAYSKNMAMKKLVTGLRVNVSSEEMSTRFSNTVNGNEELVDAFKSRVVLKSDMTFDGIEVKTHIQKKKVHVLALLDKSKAMTHYKNMLDDKLSELEQLYEKAITQALAGNSASTRKTYGTCEKKLGEIYDIVQRMELIGRYGSINQEGVALIADVQNDLSNLWNQKCDSLDEAVAQLVHAMKGRRDYSGTVQVLALMIEDSYQYSQFSARFRMLLEAQVSQQTGLRPLVGGAHAPTSRQTARYSAAKGNADYILNGSYFVKEGENQIKVIVNLVDAQDNLVAASATAILAKPAAEGLELRPQNYDQMAADRHVFRQDEIVGGGLNLEVWTDHGTDGLVLERGDEIKVYARVNQSCYLRFLYHLNNGARVVVHDDYDNYFIGSDMVNKVIELPHSFEILPPFGSETMQFFACTEKLPPLRKQLRTYGGESYEVVAGSLSKINQINRGIGVKKPKGAAVEVVEERIVLTTIR